MTDAPDGEGASAPPPPEERDLVGTVLAGRYRIVSRLGDGAMGSVYLGEHLRIGRRDAIKVLRSALARDPEAIARFTRGARNVSRIRHPNVCTLYDFGDTDDGFHFVAMEYVQGDTLNGVLRESGPMDPARAVGIAVQTAEALQAAHDLGIVHRDLKPDNIMIARDVRGAEQVKVVDFDIARGPVDEEGPAVTRHGFVVGTPEYMSPEQLTGDALDGRSDVYSLALVLFRMLSGRLPFEGSTAQEIMIQRLTVDPLTLSQAAPGLTPAPALERALARGLARKADDRPESARAFAAEVLAAVEAGAGVPAAGPAASATSATPRPAGSTGSVTDAPLGPIPATRVTGSSGDGAPAGRRPGPVVLAGGGAVVVAGLVIGAVVLFARGGESSDELGSNGVAVPDTFTRTDVTNPDPETDRFEDPDPDPPPDQDRGTGGTGEVDRDPPPPETGRSIVLAIGPNEAEEVLRRQFILQAEGYSRAAFEGARDTTLAVLEIEGLSAVDGARAHNILGLVHASLGDTARAVTHLEEAVRLDPQERYINLRDLFRRPRE